MSARAAASELDHEQKRSRSAIAQQAKEQQSKAPRIRDRIAKKPLTGIAEEVGRDRKASDRDDDGDIEAERGTRRDARDLAARRESRKRRALAFATFAGARYADRANEH